MPVWLLRSKTELVSEADALRGRSTSILDPATPHEVLDAPLRPELSAGLQRIVVGLGCFWGAERLFWSLPGVVATAAAYAGGFTENPTYEEVCSGRTGHTEVVEITFDPAQIALSDILRVFWEAHDPTQGMRQGNDVGTQYRSAIYTTSPEQLEEVQASREAYQAALARAGRGAVTTEVLPLRASYLAEAYHQQYLAKVPGGYCGLRGTGVSCPLPV